MSADCGVFPSRQWPEAANVVESRQLARLRHPENRTHVVPPVERGSVEISLGSLHHAGGRSGAIRAPPEQKLYRVVSEPEPVMANAVPLEFTPPELVIP